MIFNLDPEQEKKLVDQVADRIFPEILKRLDICDTLASIKKVTLKPGTAAMLFDVSKTTLIRWQKAGLIRKVEADSGGPLYVTSTIIEALALEKKWEPGKLLKVVRYLAEG